MSKTEAIRVNVDQETKAELERKAAEQDVSVAHLIRQGIKKLLAASLVALLLAPAAGATLHMYGEAKPRHFNWAAQAQLNVPLPNARFSLYGNADPQYFPGPREMYLPTPGRGGWTYWDERVLFLHELGHVFDFHNLSHAERLAWTRATGTQGKWWNHKNLWTRWDGWTTKIAPGEMFAEQYAACALGMTLRERDAVPAVSYGWEPPIGTDAALCALIRSSARQRR